MLSSVVWASVAVGAIPFILFLVVRFPAVFATAIIPSQVLLGGMERGSLVPGLRPGEVVLAVCLLGLLASPRWRWRRLGNHPLNGWMLLYVVTGFVIPVVTWRLRGHAVSGDVLQAYGATVKAGLLYLTLAPLDLSDRDLQTLLKAALWACVLSAAVAILQMLGFSPVEALLLEYFKGPHLYERLSGEADRATGLSGNWHSLGMEFVLALLIGWQLGRSDSRLSRWYVFGILAIILLGLATVRTLTSVVVVAGLLAVVLWQGMARKGRRLALRLTLLVGLVGAVLLVGVATAASRNVYFVTILPASLYVRVYYWLFLYWPVIRDHLWLGYGPFLPVLSAKSDDSQFVLFLLRGGVVALVGWLATVTRVFMWSRVEAVRATDTDAILARSVVVTSVVLVVSSLMQSFFTYTGVVEFYWVLPTALRP